MIDLENFRLHCEYLSLTDLRPYKEILDNILEKKIEQNERIAAQNQYGSNRNNGTSPDFLRFQNDLLEDHQ